jgi:hypothetical protein
MKAIRNLFLAAALTAFSASAATISLVPASPAVGLGDPFVLDIVVGGLGNFASPSLSAWLLDLSYDPTLFSITDLDVAFGSFLGDPVLDTLTLVDTTTTPGIVTLDQVSFLFDFELIALQPSSFTLATLTFTGIDFGTGVFGINFADLSNEAFPSESIPLDEPLAATGQVSPSAVPEPGTLSLLGLGILALAAGMRRRKG